MTLKQRVRRTELTIEFEQVYLSRRTKAFAYCDDCQRENARVQLNEAIWLLRSVLDQLEAVAGERNDADVCLYCLCSGLLDEDPETNETPSKSLSVTR